MQGIFGIYKPIGPTSNGLLNQLRKITGVRSIGHAGTLDPLASGVLVVAIGKEHTKKLTEIVGSEKEYIADIKLGANSTTDDEEGEKTPQLRQGATLPTRADVEAVLPNFIGHISQIPPIYSAIKINGKEAYKLARKGETPEMKPRDIEIKTIEILNYEWPQLKIRVVTAKGVYIRSLARDIGAKLETGGYLSGLERTRVGEFSKENSLTVEQFQDKSAKLKSENAI